MAPMDVGLGAVANDGGPFDPTGEHLRRDLAAWPNRLRPLAALPKLRSVNVGKPNHASPISKVSPSMTCAEPGRSVAANLSGPDILRERLGLRRPVLTDLRHERAESGGFAR
jgi:hypothetical protein